LDLYIRHRSQPRHHGASGPAADVGRVEGMEMVQMISKDKTYKIACIKVDLDFAKGDGLD
jgi:hypothetical protein